ncbi:peroxidase 24 [Ricinus communis]|uniref:Peroxidase n=1 Tax=Ricinus communis TaxID=3988 RepID=B9RSX6_RICCO|nr:peroxidase 24 [Ricinus communis]EEF45459.1 Peroxidase 27 precursor, putative [Ricinus communis]|eukprot:XP_002516845.3 peroxidase 24 [Ricinus communis]
MMARDGILIAISSLLVLAAVGVSNADGLSLRFYNTSCPDAELIVRNITRNRAQSDSALGAKLLRMHFHDCFVRGCDASILLDAVGIQSEKDTIPNQSLSGFDVIDEIKTQLEQVCPGVVSCADILALASRDAVSLSFQKPLWDVLTGRRDGTVSLASEVNGNIPSPFADFNTLMQQFSNKGLDVNDLVVLSGGHTIGVAHCATFTNRLYNFTGIGDMDPSLDKTYAELLKTKCPNPSNPATTVEMDPQSSLTFDKNYYDILLQNKGLFQSDAALLENTQSARIVRQLKTSNAFFAKFAISMKKMGAIEVLTGNAGQIRQNCRVVNP